MATHEVAWRRALCRLGTVRAHAMQRASIALTLAPILLSGLASSARAQTTNTDPLRWRATVTYQEVATSPKAHRIKNLEARFELTTPQIAPSAGTEGYEWRNVTIVFADSGRWHRDPSEIDASTGPATDGWWDLEDTLVVPTARSGQLKAYEQHTKRPRSTVSAVDLPTLPLRRVGSKVLIQPSGVRLLVDVSYADGQTVYAPQTGNSVIDQRSRILGKQPAHVAGENMPTGNPSVSDQYEDLPPEVAAQMRMLEAMGDSGGAENEDDMVAMMALMMDGFVEWDGKAVTGSREWTTTADDPGDYTHAIADDLTTVTHRLVWSFVPTAR